MQKSSGRMRGKLNPAVLALLVVTLLSVMAIGYHRGVLERERTVARTMKQHSIFIAKKQEDHRMCNEDREALLAENTERAKSKAVLPDELHQLEQLLNEKKDDVDECQADLTSFLGKEPGNDDNDDDDGDDGNDHDDVDEGGVRELVVSMLEEIVELTQTLAVVTGGHGASKVLLLEWLDKARSTYAKAVSVTEKYVPLSDNELLAKWNESINTVDLSTAVYVPQPKESSAARGQNTRGFNVSSWVYSGNATSEEAKDFFFLPKVIAYPMNTPTYFGRHGNYLVNDNDNDTDVQHDTSDLPTSTFLDRLSEVMDYAVCAYRTNNPNITFPDMFSQYVDGSKVSVSLNNLFTTPLVKLCVDCHEVGLESTQLKQCASHTVNDTYGSRDYWAARSLVTPYSHVDASALQWIRAHMDNEAGPKIGDSVKEFLSVVVPNPAEVAQACLSSKSEEEMYGPHYRYLKAAFPNSTNFPPSEGYIDRNASLCTRTTSQIVQRVQEVFEEARQLHGLSLSAVHLIGDKATLQQITEELSDFIIKESIQVMSNIDEPRKELTNLLVGSHATSILVSPFLQESLFVTESFLLRNDLNPGGNVYFL